MSNHEGPCLHVRHHGLSDPPSDSAGHDAESSKSGLVRGRAWSGNAYSIVSLSCSCAALVTIFIGLAQFDLPVVRYVRSVTIHLPWNFLTVPWMAFTSDAGNWIGEGSHLLAVSVVFLGGGWLYSKPVLRAAGIETLLAHGMAALLANGLKHLIGRPRPKFAHSGEWQIDPSWASGLDSFPSGHATASFAVATVLARRFPLFGPLCVSVAAFVALSRVFRGSHFPTDVFGGLVLGVISGSIASAPLKQWHSSLQDGLRHSAVGTSLAFSALWTMSRQADEEITGVLLVGLGLATVASGLWLRGTAWFSVETSAKGRQDNISVVLIAYGLAAMTTSPLVLASVGFVCLAYWFHVVGTSEERKQDPYTWRMMREGILLGSLLLALVILYNGRGVLPFQ